MIKKKKRQAVIFAVNATAVLAQEGFYVGEHIHEEDIDAKFENGYSSDQAFLNEST